MTRQIPGEKAKRPASWTRRGATRRGDVHDLHMSFGPREPLESRELT